MDQILSSLNAFFTQNFIGVFAASLLSSLTFHLLHSRYINRKKTTFQSIISEIADADYAIYLHRNGKFGYFQNLLITRISIRFFLRYITITLRNIHIHFIAPTDEYYSSVFGFLMKYFVLYLILISIGFFNFQIALIFERFVKATAAVISPKYTAERLRDKSRSKRRKLSQSEQQAIEDQITQFTDAASQVENQNRDTASNRIRSQTSLFSYLQ